MSSEAVNSDCDIQILILMKMDDGLMRRTADGQSAILEFSEGCSLVLQNITEPKWIAFGLPEAMSEELRNREGDISIEEFRDGDDVAVVVTIDGDAFAYCSTPEAQKFLARRPAMLFTR